MVRVNDELSQHLAMKVQQVCLILSLLFYVCEEAVMMKGLDGIDNGVKIGGKLIQTIGFADDHAMITNTEE